jgi:hypothetical protein
MLGFEDHKSWVVACRLLTSHETAQTDCCNYWLNLPVFDKIYQDYSVASTALNLVFCHSPSQSFEQLFVRKKFTFYFIYGLFKNATSCSDCIPQNGRMVVNVNWEGCEGSDCDLIRGAVVVYA